MASKSLESYLTASPNLDQIFSSILTSKIFKKRDLLRPDYVPQELPHRDHQIGKLASILASSLKGSRPSNIFIYGHVGTGKTAVTRFVLNRLSEKGKGHGLQFDFVYINCRMFDTGYRILADICTQINVDIPFTGLSSAEVFRRLLKGLKNYSGLFFIILDEIDSLVKKAGDDVLYRLVRINGELEQAKVAIIGITNVLKLIENLDPRIKSSLGEEEIVFPPYNAEQLEDILTRRSKDAFIPTAIGQSVISLCAALGAKEHGDARRALELLRIAGEIAEREGSSKVEEEHVRTAHMEIEKDKSVEFIRNMPIHEKLVLLSACAANRHSREVTTGNIYETYNQMVRDAGLDALTPRRVTDYINEMDTYGIIYAKIVNKGRYGRTKIITPAVPDRVIREALHDEKGLVKFVET